MRNTRVRRRFGPGAVLTAALLLVVQGCSFSSYDQGRRALENGRPDEAIAHFDTAIEEGTRPLEARRDRGAALVQIDDPSPSQLDRAIGDLQAVLEQSPRDQRALFWLASAYTKKAQTYEPRSPRDYTRSEYYRESARFFEMYRENAPSNRARDRTGLQLAWIEDRLDTLAADSLATLDVEPAPNSVTVLACLSAEDERAQQIGVEFADENYRYLAHASPQVLTDQLLEVGALDVVRAPVSAKMIERETASLVVENQVRAPQGTSSIAYRVFTTIQPVGDDRMALSGFVNSDLRGTVRMPRFEGAMEDVHQLHFELARAILEHMGVQATAEEQFAMGRRPERSFDLFLAYGEGLFARNVGDFEAAAQAFQRASRIDPGFGIAARQAQFALARQATPTANDPVPVPAPPVAPSSVEAMNTSTMGDLGLGLTPEEGAGAAESEIEAEVGDATAARGEATIRVTGRAGGR